MSRSNKPRCGRYHFKGSSGGGHSYRSKAGVLQWAKRIGNKWMRRVVRERLKDVLFTDAYDEERLPSKKVELIDMWYYD